MKKVCIVFALLLATVQPMFAAPTGPDKAAKPERFEVYVEPLEELQTVRVLVVNNASAPVNVKIYSPSGELLLQDKVSDIDKFARNYKIDTEKGEYTFHISNGAYEVTRKVIVK